MFSSTDSLVGFSNICEVMTEQEKKKKKKKKKKQKMGETQPAHYMGMKDLHIL